MTESTSEQPQLSWNFDDHVTPDEVEALNSLNRQLGIIDALGTGLNAERAVKVREILNSTRNLLAEIRRRVSNRAEQDFARNHYRTAFASASLGTEEELPATIQLMTTDWSLFGVVSRIDDPEVLVQITKDLQVSALGDLGEYTIELRTTPTELSDQAGWRERRLALQALISTIEKNVGGHLSSKAAGAYRITIFNPGNLIRSVTDGTVKGTAKHATVGVAAAEIGTGVTLDDRQRLRKVHPLLTLPWYAERFTADPGLLALEDREKVSYAFVMSAVLKLAQIWTRYPDRLHLLEAKSMWDVLPRTPPVQILNSLRPVASTAARRMVTNRAVPAWAADWGQVPSAEVWEKARRHILAEGEMGGHPPAAATVGGRPAMLFEYRAGIPDTFADAWWKRI